MIAELFREVLRRHDALGAANEVVRAALESQAKVAREFEAAAAELRAATPEGIVYVVEGRAVIRDQNQQHGVAIRAVLNQETYQ